MGTQQRSRPKKKFYTIEQANATLPLLRQILRDVTELAGELRQRHERLAQLQDSGAMTPAHSEEVETMLAANERDHEKMHEYEEELRNLNVELKDYFTGLIDFHARMNGREVFLCWRLGEPDVAHWHELDAGFQGRQKLAETPETIR